MTRTSNDEETAGIRDCAPTRWAFNPINLGQQTSALQRL